MENIIDWQEALHLAGNNPQTAKALLQMLLLSLPSERATIRDAYTQKQYSQLKEALHRLLGALCYCGVPTLKNATAALHSALKNNRIEDAGPLFQQFDSLVEKTIEELQKFVVFS